MAGKRHHYVPRFLQAGFNSRPGEQVPHAWRYLKGETQPKELALSHIGVGKRFYDFNGGGVHISADAAVTRAESDRYAAMVRHLRDGTMGTTPGPTEIADLCSHLYLRTKAFWAQAELPIAPLAARMKALAQDAQAQARALQKLVLARPEVFMHFLAHRYPAVDIERALAAFADQGLSELPQAADGGASIVVNLPWEQFAQLAIRQTKVLTMEESSETAAVSPRFTSCEFHVEEFPRCPARAGRHACCIPRGQRAGFHARLA